MMRTILVPLAQSLAGEPALQAALAVAKRMNSHIRAMFVRPEPETAMSYLPILPMVGAAAGVTRDAIEKEGRQAAEAARVSFDAWRSRQKLPEAPADARLDSCFATWTEQVGEIEPAVTHFGRVSDLIVMSRFKANDLIAGRCFDAAVFGSGRPTLVVSTTLPWDMLDHVMIAWNGSLEASHAVFGAMPLLRAAGRVSIFCVQEAETDQASGAELAEALSWYGIPARHVGGPETQGSTGAALLAMARGSETTLIVMGAYTHSRLRQSFLGGVTREVLADATIPVLMSH
jgi:nucleotide-binding universal stress UspA family protein